MGIYLGPSPRHAKSVSLVMNPSNGLISPQFHIQHDKFFETINRKVPKVKAPWKTLAGFRGKTMLPKEPVITRMEAEDNDDNSTHSLRDEVIREMEQKKE
jgi:hypothetical protein